MIANYRYVGNSQQKATTPGDTRSLCWEIGQRQKTGNASSPPGPDGLDPLPDTFRNLPSAACSKGADAHVLVPLVSK